MAEENPSARQEDGGLLDDAAELDAPIVSPVLVRLVKEVRGGDLQVARSYNRTYNRHNR